jgi:hypothetical protein
MGIHAKAHPAFYSQSNFERIVIVILEIGGRHQFMFFAPLFPFSVSSSFHYLLPSTCDQVRSSMHPLLLLCWHPNSV